MNRLTKNCRREQGRKPKAPGAPAVTEARRQLTPPQSSVLAEALGTVTAAFQPNNRAARCCPRFVCYFNGQERDARGEQLNSAGKSLAACLAESSAAAENGGSIRLLAGGGASRRLGCWITQICQARCLIAGHAKRIRRFKSFSVYGVGAAFASFLAPLPAFTSTSVADIV